jgi:predicted RNA-binding protein with TRAM domain
MNDSSDDDIEIGPQKSAEELLRERERLAEARGDVIDVGADDADAAMPPVSVKPEGPTPAVAAAVAKKATTAANRHAAIEMGERVRIRVKRILGPPAHGTVVGHVVGFEGDTYDIEHGEGFHLIISNVKRGDRVSRTREEITLWDPRG